MSDTPPASPWFRDATPSPSPTPPRPSPARDPLMLGEYMIKMEFNYDDYCFLNKQTMVPVPVLSPVTDSRVVGGLGRCRYYCLYDVCQTRFSILEATLPRGQGRYFAYKFGAKLSVQQLIDTDYGMMTELLNYMEKSGVTSESDYDTKARPRPGSNVKDCTGCVRFKAMRRQTFVESNLYPRAEDLEAESKSIDTFGASNPCTDEIRSYGPVVGVYKLARDHHLLCQVPIFKSTSEDWQIGPSGNIAHHCVMLIGFGLAIHETTGERLPYYVFQDNRGEDPNRRAIGRIACSQLSFAFAPMIEGQNDLVQYRTYDNGVMRLIEKEALQG